LSGKRFRLAPGTFGLFRRVYGFGKKIEDGITVFTIEFVDGHGRSLPIESDAIRYRHNKKWCFGCQPQ
jgi:hypothetical protein